MPLLTEDTGSAPDPVDVTWPVGVSSDPAGDDTQRSSPPDDTEAANPPVSLAPLLDFEATEGSPLRDLSSELPVIADVVVRDGGSVLTTSTPWGEPALLFPPFSEASNPPRAIVRVMPQGEGGDPLSPGLEDFIFGADFAVDVDSHGTKVDSGNNLVQRGLASDPSHFKLEVDARRPSCRIKGPQGDVELRTDQRIQAERWHRVRCSRTGSVVELTVYRMGGQTPVLVESKRAESPTGDLQWSPGTPLAIGGKLAANGVMIRSQTDQYNGLMSAPVFDVGR